MLKRTRGLRLTVRSGRLAAAAVMAVVIASVTTLMVAAPASAAQSCHINSTWHISPVASNGLAAAAEIGWTGNNHGLLRARTATSAIGPWERFSPVCVNGPGQLYALQSADDGHYVSAEVSWTGDQYGLLRDRATSIGPWEKFQILFTSDGNSVTIKSDANGKYVSAELGWTGDRKGELRARASSVGAWETFGLWLS